MYLPTAKCTVNKQLRRIKPKQISLLNLHLIFSRQIITMNQNVCFFYNENKMSSHQKIYEQLSKTICKTEMLDVCQVKHKKPVEIAGCR